jgi:hypothetical protein
MRGEAVVHNTAVKVAEAKVAEAKIAGGAIAAGFVPLGEVPQGQLASVLAVSRIPTVVVTTHRTSKTRFSHSKSPFILRNTPSTSSIGSTLRKRSIPAL